MKVLITGSNGFIGKNLSANFALREDVVVLPFDLPQTVDELKALIPQADMVFHLAGVNRPEDPNEFDKGNAGLTIELTRLLEHNNRKLPIVISSSIQAELDNRYGKSKKLAEDAVFTYAQKTGSPVYVYRFPNVFGKWCKPNYNSVVATFCHNAAHGLPLRVDNPEKELALVYIDDIVNEFNAILNNNKTEWLNPGEFCRISPVYSITLGALAKAIEGFAQSRTSLVQAHDKSNPLVRKLYATFLSCLPLDGLNFLPDMKHDARGYFAELIKSPHFGQISVSRTKPGITRGNHWHNTKVEKFIVVQGEAVIRLRKINSDEVAEYPVSGKTLEIVDIPPGYTHNIENIGNDDVLTIFWAGELYEPENPDTYFWEV